MRVNSDVHRSCINAYNYAIRTLYKIRVGLTYVRDVRFTKYQPTPTDPRDELRLYT